ncbi:MAG: sulfotransferase family 2 domain-containing protein [Methylobacter tundripaludum]|nr:sulfotransferase family 2 domain-containing protein [Methylobacter tundripaludum]
MKTRQLNYSATSYSHLSRNPAHQVAAEHALRIYKSNAIYSFIPKNACTTLRVSLALANGCIADKSDFNWIHHNNDAFKADLPSLALADYTFVILRCPYARLASAYLDKMVEITPDTWSLYDALQRKIELDALTFRVFIKAITRPPLLHTNIHWRPQTDFLVYKEYDDYFNLENFAAAISVIENKTNMAIVDARNLTKHGIDRYTFLNDAHYADTPPDDIKALKKAGAIPNPALLYDDEIISRVKKNFKEDIALYTDLFGSANLMFS